MPPANLRWPGIKNLILDDNGARTLRGDLCRRTHGLLQGSVVVFFSEALQCCCSSKFGSRATSRPGISDWGILSAVNASFPDLVALQLNDNARRLLLQHT